LTAAKTQAAFARQAHQSQLDDLTARARLAKDSQQAPQLLSQQKIAKEELARTITQLEEKLRSEDQEERQVFSAETTLEIALAKLEGELTGLQEKLALEYNLTLDELQTQPYEINNATKAKSEVDSGRLRLRQLEPVNLLAIEEFDKAKERLNFIEAQLADLNSARDNLRTLIGELDLKAEQTFVETMQQVSAIFSETFAKLFLGGEAKIALTPGVPPLDAEIEISVRPSGRKWLPLPLLSGGERSLSAIAILFSLLKIRPSPFCFLDEVDAALDDANIGRFNEMVRDFSAQSQIIIITHNKRTMSVADTIYGVTMEEPGISKIISMKLAEVAVA
jgi:chromosome segregation protein